MICWKIRIFAYWTTPVRAIGLVVDQLWFAEKFVSLLIEQHLRRAESIIFVSCDLLKNSYLCLLNNTQGDGDVQEHRVVICWKIRIFAYWTTPLIIVIDNSFQLWFAEKFVSLLIEQHPSPLTPAKKICCDLLKNSYLCLLNNTALTASDHPSIVVICWKIRIFAYWTTPDTMDGWVLSALWFAEKFVSLLIEQHQPAAVKQNLLRCDLLKNSYLCLLNNTQDE